MVRVFISTVIGVIIGIGAGLGLGWGFPAQYSNSTLPELGRVHQDTYTVMIAAGYVNDRDITGAFERLQRLGVENVPAHVQSLWIRSLTVHGSLSSQAVPASGPAQRSFASHVPSLSPSAKPPGWRLSSST